MIYLTTKEGNSILCGREIEESFKNLYYFCKKNNIDSFHLNLNEEKSKQYFMKDIVSFCTKEE